MTDRRFIFSSYVVGAITYALLFPLYMFGAFAVLSGLLFFFPLSGYALHDGGMKGELRPMIYGCLVCLSYWPFFVLAPALLYGVLEGMLKKKYRRHVVRRILSSISGGIVSICLLLLVATFGLYYGNQTANLLGREGFAAAPGQIMLAIVFIASLFQLPATVLSIPLSLCIEYLLRGWLSSLNGAD